jgi:hypothetical protein
VIDLLGVSRDGEEPHPSRIVAPKFAALFYSHIETAALCGVDLRAATKAALRGERPLLPRDFKRALG